MSWVRLSGLVLRAAHRRTLATRVESLLSSQPQHSRTACRRPRRCRNRGLASSRRTRGMLVLDVALLAPYVPAPGSPSSYFLILLILLDEIECSSSERTVHVWRWFHGDVWILDWAENIIDHTNLA